jgi:hypothetical protein
VDEAAAGRAWLLPPATTADGDAFTGCEQTRVCWRARRGGRP